MTDIIRAENDVVAEYAVAGVKPTQISDDLYAFVTPPGAQGKSEVVVVDRRQHDDRYLDRPRRKTGTSTVVDVDSFLREHHKHATPDTEVWADLDARRVTAIYNAHGKDAAGHGDHRLVLALQHTPEWLAFASRDGRLTEQEEFAEFIEQQGRYIVQPDAATMLEVAQSIEGTRQVSFASGTRLSDGRVILQYTEEGSATAGKGQIEIPDEFILGLRVFQRGDPYRVTAKFRYRLRGGSLTVGYALLNPEVIVEDAFTGIVDKIIDALDGAVLFGRA